MAGPLRLWILRPRGASIDASSGLVEFDGMPYEDYKRGPWGPLDDVVEALVVAAPDEVMARRLASNAVSADEAWIWLDPVVSECEEQLLEGRPRVVLVQPSGSA